MNRNPDDGCADCAITMGYSCEEADNGAGRSVCNPVCGDGYVIPGVETCDDMNDLDRDGCSAICKTEAGWWCERQFINGSQVGDLCHSICGDGIRVGLEECDDGNEEAGDGCYGCVVEYGFECFPVGSGVDMCITLCGDSNILFGVEQYSLLIWLQTVLRFSHSFRLLGSIPPRKIGQALRS